MIRIVSRAALCGLFLVARAASAQDTQPQDFAIHGQATAAEVTALIEDGVPVAPLPLPVTPPKQLN